MVETFVLSQKHFENCSPSLHSLELQKVNDDGCSTINTRLISSLSSFKELDGDEEFRQAANTFTIYMYINTTNLNTG